MRETELELEQVNGPSLCVVKYRPGDERRSQLRRSIQTIPARCNALARQRSMLVLDANKP